MGQCQAGSNSTYSEDVVVGREKRHRKVGRASTRKNSVSTCHAASGNIRLATLLSPKSRRLSEEYVLLDKSLGHGMSGDVHLAKCLRSGGFVAVKTLDKTGLTKKEQNILQREVDIHVRLDHGNVVRLLQVFDEGDKVYLVTEYCTGGTLADRLKEKGRFEEKEALDVIRQVLNAVSYCHGRPTGKVIHRDIKLDNFVYDHKGHDGVLKLLDFGLSRILTPGGPLLKNGAGTLEFIAPEVLRNEQHGEACDLWAVGVMAYKLLSGKLPFDGADDNEVERAILRGEFQMDDDIWAGISDAAKVFIKELLSSDPAERPSAAAALCRPWMCMGSIKAEVENASPTVEVLRNIENFATENAMRRAAAAIAVYSQTALEGNDVTHAEKLFQSLADGKGAISQGEFTKVLQRELNIGEERCRWVFEQLDFDGDCEIQRSEFLAAVVGTRLLSSRSEIDKAFKCFDLSKDGKLHSWELTDVLGDRFCGTSTKQIFAQLDTNGDRVVDFDEFSSMVSTTASDLTPRSSV